MIGCIGGEMVVREAMNWADRSRKIPLRAETLGFGKWKECFFGREMKGFD